MGRRKKCEQEGTEAGGEGEKSQSTVLFDYATPNLMAHYPTLTKVSSANELTLLDLSAIQIELERLVLHLVQRTSYLEAESKGKPLPLTTTTSTNRGRGRRRRTDLSNNSPPPLIVKADPDKPLTLIISQCSSPVATTPGQVTTAVLPPYPGRVRTMSRRSNRSSTDDTAHQNPPLSPSIEGGGQSTNNYTIPNKFWELMEPYCAEITESNINYLEGLVRSYQDVESVYLQPPKLESSSCSSYEARAAKRIKREQPVRGSQVKTATISPSQSTTVTDSSLPLLVSYNLANLAESIESQLSGPFVEESSFNKLAHSVLDECCSTNKNATQTLSSGYNMASSNQQPPDSTTNSPISSSAVAVKASQSSCSLLSLQALMNTNRDDHFSPTSSNQSFKQLAKRLGVSSSSRVEKKIGQAIDELGLVDFHSIATTMSSKQPTTYSVAKSPTTNSNKMVVVRDRTAETVSNANATIVMETTPTPTTTEDTVQPVKRKRGRPRKTPKPEVNGGGVETADSAVSRKSSLRAVGKTRRTSHSGEHAVSSHAQLNGDDCTATVAAERASVAPSSPRSSIVEANRCCLNGFLSSNEPEDGASDDQPKSVNEDRLLAATSELAKRVNQYLRLDDNHHHDKTLLATTDDYPALVNGDDCGVDHQDDDIDVNRLSDAVQLLPEANKLSTSTITAPSIRIVKSPSLRDRSPGEASDSPTRSTISSLPKSPPQIDQRSFASTHPSLLLDDIAHCSNDFESLLRLFGASDSSHRHGDDSLIGQQQPSSFSQPPPNATVPSPHIDELAHAILQRQHDLRAVCSANHGVLRRLLQAARREMQRQEIQRRLAIADADSFNCRSLIANLLHHRSSSSWRNVTLPILSTASGRSNNFLPQSRHFHRSNHDGSSTNSSNPWLFATLAVTGAASLIHFSDRKRCPIRVSCATSDRASAIKSLEIVADVADETQPAVVSVSTFSGRGLLSRHSVSKGSGFIINKQGHVITNAHVVGYGTEVDVALSDGRSFRGHTVAVDVSSDLALVKLDVDTKTAASLPNLPLADNSRPTRPGHFVLALGSPLMLSNSVTVGVVSAVDRDLGHAEGLRYLQTDATITFGNSGGPLVNLYGEVIGVDTMIAGSGVGFAVPVHMVRKFHQLALKAVDSSPSRSPVFNSPTLLAGPTTASEWSSKPNSEQPRRYLGLVMRTLTREMADELGSRLGWQFDVPTGVVIHSVLQNSPAQRAGLKTGDIVISIDGLPIKSAQEVYTATASRDELTITVFRKGQRLTFDHVKTERV